MIIQTTTLFNSTNSEPDKLKIYLYGYDNYSYKENSITFYIYSMKYEVNNYPNIIFFTVDILFDYIFRNLAEQTNKNITFSLEDEKKLVEYKCILNIEKN